MKSDANKQPNPEADYGPEVPNYAVLNEQRRQQKLQRRRLRMRTKMTITPTVLKSVLPILLLIVSLAFISCATSQEGLEREARITAAVQKGVDYTRDNVLPLVPSPYKETLGAIALAASAGIAYWNTNQGKRLKDLEQTNGTAYAKGHAAGIVAASSSKT